MRVRPWSAYLNLRQWQQDCFSEYKEARQQNYLIIATPGAGKTLIAGRIAHHMVESGLVQRLCVVCPTEHLKNQWEAKLADCGLRVDKNFKNSSKRGPDKDSLGTVLTYQQVAMHPSLHAEACKKSTLVILDEIHHAADELSWGDALEKAFAGATRRLLLSGTPFRSDNTAIAYIKYQDGYCQPDFVYTYKEALMDNVCRSIVFPAIDGDMTWLKGERERRASFETELAETEYADRLRTALDANNQWLKTVLVSAHRQLLTLREEGHRNAGGLVLAVNQEHAKQIAMILKDVLEVEPVLAISEDAEASSKIENFSASDMPWLVCVKMVSEGVDIPRLRVGVYATNVTTELFFRQAVGRLVRWIKHPPEQTAYMFIPPDPRLVACAIRIQDEIAAMLDERTKKIPTGTNGNGSRGVVPFVSRAAEATQRYLLIGDGRLEEKFVSEVVRPIRDKHGLTDSPEMIAAVLVELLEALKIPLPAALLPPPQA